MNRVACAVAILLLIPCVVGAADISRGEAVATAVELAHRVGGYSTEHPEAGGAMAAWASRLPVDGDPVLVHSYPELESVYYHVTLETDPPTFVTLDAESGAWHAYGETSARGIPLVSRASAAATFAGILGRPCEASDLRVVTLPNKHLYWHLDDSRDGEPRELFLNLSDPDDLRTEAGDASPIDLPSGARGGGLPDLLTPRDVETAPRGRFPTSYDIEGVPHYYQETSYHCGPAALEMIYDYWGPHVNQTDIGYVADTQSSYGTYTIECTRASHFSWFSTAILDTSLHGYDERQLGYTGVEHYWSADYADRYNDLKEMISTDDPVFILTWFDESHGTGHFRVVKGYDDNTDVFIVHDPWYAGAYSGPDVHFNQAFLVDDLWVYSGHWGLFIAPWDVSVTAPSEVDEGAEFTVSATATYRAPHPFESQVQAATPQMTLTPPLGFELAPGETADRYFAGWWWSGSDSGEASWQVVAVSAPVPLAITVEARGFVSESSGSSGSYSDWIGGPGSATVAINMENPPGVIYVDAAGGAHFETIQEGLDVAAEGDTVVVAAGTYTGPMNRELDFAGKGILLVAADGRSETVIDCGGAGRGFDFMSGEGAGTIIDGFTITNGSPAEGFGGAIRCMNASSPTIRNCAVVGNSSGFFGGGMYCEGSCSPTLSHVVFRGNTSAFGAGLHLKTDSDATISHCTFAENSGTQISCASSSPTITNSIIAFSLNAGPVSCGGTSIPTITHCCAFGNAGGDSLCGDYSENLFTDPLFCDLAAGELTLHDDSPCLPANNVWLESIGALGSGDCGTGTGIQEGEVGRLALSSPRPNPFRGSTVIEFSIPEPGGRASLAVYNLKGQRVKTLLDGPVARGSRRLAWDGRDDGGRRVASGVYFFTLEGGGETVSKKAVLLR